MKELNRIFNFYKSLKLNTKIKCALASVVFVEGSSYRRTGARMLVSENGIWEGGISGGCLEGDALKKARLAILKNKPQIIRYDTTKGDDHQIGVGLGCNGIIDILFQPVNFLDNNNPIELLKKAVRTLSPVFFITDSPNKPELLGNMWLGETPPKYLDGLVNEALITEVLDQKKSKNIVLSNGLRLFVEIISKPIVIYIFGHQYDIYTLIELCNFLEWKVCIVAPSVKIKNEANVSIVEPAQFDTTMISEYSAVLLMSHSYETDKQNLKKLIGHKLKYIGILGPKIRSEKILSELNQEGFQTNNENIFAPIGLDIGANTPEEIALSMVSEIKAVFSDRDGKNLKFRKDPINDRDKPMVFN
jgi:xanthine/CO dehydrogenase XdhC/CoxF family maturation factor